MNLNKYGCYLHVNVIVNSQQFKNTTALQNVNSVKEQHCTATNVTIRVNSIKTENVLQSSTISSKGNKPLDIAHTNEESKTENNTISKTHPEECRRKTRGLK